METQNKWQQNWELPLEPLESYFASLVGFRAKTAIVILYWCKGMFLTNMVFFCLSFSSLVGCVSEPGKWNQGKYCVLRFKRLGGRVLLGTLQMQSPLLYALFRCSPPLINLNENHAMMLMQRTVQPQLLWSYWLTESSEWSTSWSSFGTSYNMLHGQAEVIGYWLHIDYKCLRGESIPCEMYEDILVMGTIPVSMTTVMTR